MHSKNLTAVTESPYLDKETKTTWCLPRSSDIETLETLENIRKSVTKNSKAARYLFIKIYSFSNIDIFPAS